MKKSYDATVARIAGNIACGLIQRYGFDEISNAMSKTVAIVCVTIARDIVEETKDTEAPDSVVMATGQGRDDA